MTQSHSRRFLLAAVGGVVLYCGATLALAWWWYRASEVEHLAHSEARLSAIADLKVHEVAAWRRERTADGMYFMDNPGIAALAQTVLRAPNAPAGAELRDFVRRMQRNHDYDWIAFYDATGQVRVAEPEGAIHDAHMHAEVEAAVRDGALRFLDPHLDADGRTHMAIVAPLMAGEDGQRPGAMVLRLDATRTFAPLLARWPLPAQTAELRLVRRAGSDIVVMNGALGLPVEGGTDRVPSSRMDLPVVRAGLGQSGLIEGITRRGQRVVGVARAVPGADWSLLASQSRDELMGPFRQRAQAASIIVVLLLGAGVAAFGWVWRSHTRRLHTSEQELLAALTKMAQIVEASPTVLFQWSGDGRRVLWVSPNVARWSFDADRLMANDPEPESFLHPDDHARVRAELEKQVAAGATHVDQRYRVVCPDGRLVWVDDRSTVVRDGEGHVVRLDSIVTDVTEQTLLQAQFVQAQKMETVGRLAGGVAHDFNNLLTVINGYAEFAVMELPEGHPVQPMVREIHEAGQRAASLTRQLLAFSRRQVVQPVTLNLNVNAEHMQKMLQRLIGEDVRLSLDLDPALWAIRGDPGQVEQVIMNLAVNARDAMPDGGTLAISTRNVSDDGEWVLLSVADTGTGMDEATRQRIFEPFFTTKKAGQGTGLGLATVYGIVTQAGGRIDVSTTLGRGTTMRIFWPREVGAAATDQPATPESLTRGQGERVLLVEDEEALQRIAEKILVSAGYAVVVAGNGQDALSRLQEADGAFDLVVSDVVMPVMSGHELVRQIRKRWPSIRILLASGYLHEAFPESFQADAAFEFVAKPYSPSTLSRRVRDVLDKA